MKREFIIPLLLVLIPSVALAGVEVTPSSTITVSDAVINPGEDGTLSFTVTNTGSVEINSLNVVLSSDLNLYTESFKFNDVEVGEGMFLTTTYSAPKNMTPGAYEVRVEVSASTGDDSHNTQTGTIIKVKSSNYLITSSYTSSLLINNDTNFVINLTNEGDDDLNDVLVDLILPDGFIPETQSQFYINSLSPGESKEVSTVVFVERSVEPDSYQFTLEKTADSYNDSDTLNVVVNGAPDVSFSGLNLDPEIPKAGTSQTISVQVENIGSGKAYDVIADLSLEENVTGITMEYLGTLERDDLTSAIFDITTPSVSELEGDVLITYEDGDGVSYSTSQSLNFDVLKADSTSPNYLIWILGIIIIGFFIYKNYIKK